jgi:putative transposase
VFNMGLSLRTQMYGRLKLSDSKVINELKKVLTNHVNKQGGFA